MANQLTDRNFWLNYWESKTGLAFKIQPNYPFIQVLDKLIGHRAVSMLEIGGFPGYYAVWAKKNRNVQATLLDFVIHKTILNQLEEANDLPAGSIQTLEADLFEYQPAAKFDIVVSNGLIEHFNDTKDILQRHVAFLNDKGALLVTLPNFAGLNGWFQKTFDAENYSKHNIRCMDIHYLTELCQSLHLKDIDVYYHGRFMLWLEDASSKPLFARWLLKMLWLPLKLILKIIPVETKAFSPYIVISARV